MSFGGQEEAPAGAPPKNLGETGGWDPDAIEGLSFAKMEGKQDNDQGRSYAGLMTAEQHAAKKAKVAAEAFTQAEQEADPTAFRRKRAQEAIRKDESFKDEEEKARQARLDAKRAKLAAELEGGGGSAGVEIKGGIDKKTKKKKKKAKVKSSLLSFGDGDDE